MSNARNLYKGNKEQLVPPSNFTKSMIEEYNRIKELFKDTPFVDNFEHALLENIAYSYGKYCEFRDKLDITDVDNDPKSYDNYYKYMNNYYNSYLNGLKEIGATTLTRIKYMSKDLEEADKPENRFSKFTLPGDRNDGNKK